MAYIAGVVLGLIIVAAGRISGFDRDKSFYPTILIVIALYYLIFGIVDGRYSIIIIELVIAVIFVSVALLGAKRLHWLVAVGLAAHGGYDIFHDEFLINAGVPTWWPPFCFAVDEVLAISVLVFLRKRY